MPRPLEIFINSDETARDVVDIEQLVVAGLARGMVMRKGLPMPPRLLGWAEGLWWKGFRRQIDQSDAVVAIFGPGASEISAPSRAMVWAAYTSKRTLAMYYPGGDVESGVLEEDGRERMVIYRTQAEADTEFAHFMDMLEARPESA